MKGFALVALAMAAGVLVFVQPHLEERWALYLGSASQPAAARLFLDPFPTLGSCEATVRVFARNDERAFCAGRRDLAFGSAADAVLAADFASLVPRAWYCPPRAGVAPTGWSCRFGQMTE